MKNWKRKWGIALAVVLVLSAADGLCTMFGVAGTEHPMNMILGNILGGVFFVPVVAMMVYANKDRELAFLKRIRLTSLVILLSNTLLFILVGMAVSMGASVMVSNILTFLWTLLNLPFLNSFVILPVFGWSVVLVTAIKLVRGLKN